MTTTTEIQILPREHDTQDYNLYVDLCNFIAGEMGVADPGAYVLERMRVDDKNMHINELTGRFVDYYEDKVARVPYVLNNFKSYVEKTRGPDYVVGADNNASLPKRKTAVNMDRSDDPYADLDTLKRITVAPVTTFLVQEAAETETETETETEEEKASKPVVLSQDEEHKEEEDDDNGDGMTLGGSPRLGPVALDTHTIEPLVERTHDVTVVDVAEGQEGLAKTTDVDLSTAPDTTTTTEGKTADVVIVDQTEGEASTPGSKPVTIEEEEAAATTEKKEVDGVLLCTHTHTELLFVPSSVLEPSHEHEHDDEEDGYIHTVVISGPPLPVQVPAPPPPAAESEIKLLPPSPVQTLVLFPTPSLMQATSPPPPPPVTAAASEAVAAAAAAAAATTSNSTTRPPTNALSRLRVNKHQASAAAKKKEEKKEEQEEQEEEDDEEEDQEDNDDDKQKLAKKAESSSSEEEEDEEEDDDSDEDEYEIVSKGATFQGDTKVHSLLDLAAKRQQDTKKLARILDAKP